MRQDEIAVIEAALALHRAFRDQKSYEDWISCFRAFKLACEQLDQSRGVENVHKS